MRSISVREMRAALPRLEQLLAEEGEVTITRNGELVARLLPTRSHLPIPSHADLRSRMPRLEMGSEVLIRQDRDER
jgi:antitoxin (DNA-binding transcriptional repressor) of toxin-antitoxin stability system